MLLGDIAGSCCQIARSDLIATNALGGAVPGPARLSGYKPGHPLGAGSARTLHASLGAMSASQVAVVHHFTVDVEEYFQVAAFESVIPRYSWGRFESRVRVGVTRLLELLARHSAAATFFVLGWLADRHPNVVREITAAGHEIASHGWDHRRVSQQTVAQFRSSVRDTKRLLEDITGAPVVGFRAPNFSIVPGCEWALDILIEEGYRYDSSLFPIRRRGYGYPNGQRDPHVLTRMVGTLAEVPPAVLSRWGLVVPAGGGAYFRILPYRVVQVALRDCERRSCPGTFYIHPWELDSGQPRVTVPLATRLRHYTGLGRVTARLDRLLRQFRFGPIGNTVTALLGPRHERD